MSQLAIKAEGLSKKYEIGSAEGPSDSIRDALSGLSRKIAAGLAGGPKTEFWALNNVSFEIARGENVGIIGGNGAGKSTLLKTLSQIITPTKGRAEIHGRLGALLEVGTGFHPELTGRENVFLYGSILGMSRAEVAGKFDQIVEFSEIGKFIDTPVKRYSSGMYVRLAFAVAAHLDPDILLLDEVLAVGDFNFQKKCIDFTKSLERKGATILFVSHNMFSIKSMCPRVIYLRKGEVVFDGPTDEGLRLYEADNRLVQSHWFKGESGADMEPPFTVTDITLTDEAGEKKTVFDYGERLRVRLHYRTTRPIERPDLRIGINRSDEAHCCTYSTQSDHVDLPTLDGEGVIELLTPPMRLVADMYFTTISLRERDAQIASQIGEAFHIRHPVFQTHSYGVFHEPGDWSVDPVLEQAAFPVRVGRRA